jgi:hypothetical protein
MRIVIESINIYLTPDAKAAAPATASTAAPAQTEANKPPSIGEYWPAQGGIYAGVARGRDGERDYHLILSTEAPKEDFTWQAALDRAKSISVDGHSDFTVPTRFESALLYTNLQDQFDTDYWYWTSTQYSEDDAWTQSFGNGSQRSGSKVYERRCRFVRRSVL